MATTWNPADKAASATLSNNDLTSTTDSGSWQGARTTDSKSAGKHYFEVSYDVAGAMSVGIGTASSDLSFVGNSQYSAGFLSNGGSVFFTGGSVSYSWPTWSTGDILGVAVDMDATSVSFYRNNSLLGSNDFSSGLTPIFAMVSVVSGAVGMGHFTAASQTYAAPSGYSAWDAVTGTTDTGFLITLLNGAIQGIKGAAKSALPYFDGSKWAVKEAGTIGQVLSIDSSGNLSWVAQTAGSVADGSVTNAKLATVAPATIKGRTTAGTGAPEDLTAAQVRAILNVADGATAGAGTDPVVQTLMLNKTLLPTLTFREGGVVGSGWSFVSDAGYFNICEAENTAAPAIVIEPLATGSIVMLKRNLTFGNGSAANAIIEFNNGATEWPKLRYSNANSRWEYSNDGTTYVPIAHVTGDGNLHVPATSTTNSGKVLTAGAAAGSLSWQTPATGIGTDPTAQTLTLDKTAAPALILREGGVVGSGWLINSDSGYLNFLEAENTSNVVLGLEPGVDGGFVTKKRVITFGNGAQANGAIEYNNGATNWPTLRYNDTTDHWEYRDIGTAFVEIAHATGDGNLHVPATSTTNNGRMLVAGSSAGALAWADPPSLQTTGTAAIYSLASAESRSTTTLADVASWSFSTVVGKIYKIKIVGTYQSGATTTGIKMGVYCPTGAGTIRGYMEGGLSKAAVATELKATIYACAASNATGSNLTTTAVDTINSPVYIGGEMVFTCTTAGTFRVQLASEVAFATQLNAGSIMIVELLN